MSFSSSRYIFINCKNKKNGKHQALQLYVNYVQKMEQPAFKVE